VSRSAGQGWTACALGLITLALAPAALVGQGGEWPTLAGAGIEYLSPSGAFQVSLSGQLDVEGVFVTNSWSSLVSLEGGTDVLFSTAEDCSACHVDEPLESTRGALAAHRLRLFTDVFLGDHVYSLIQLQTDRGSSPSDGKVRARVEQAYLRVITRSGAWGVQSGRFASPVGSYPLRHLSVVDPFVRPPLAYDYRTLMNRTVVPGDATGLVGWKDQPGPFRRAGVPPVWDVPYQWGAMLFGRVLGLDLRVAAMNSAPSSAPDVWGFGWDRLEDPSWVVAARVRPRAEIEVGASWNRGPWMEPFTTGEIQVPPGAAPGWKAPSFRDFDQELLTVDATYARGSTMVRAEAMLDRWAVPNVAGRPTERLYNLEVQRDLSPGLFAALRLGHIDFRPLPESTLPGAPDRDWDFDVTRVEGSLGYRITRNGGLLLSAFEQVQAQASDADGRFAGLRLWWSF
jgi:hypothetical protein